MPMFNEGEYGLTQFQQATQPGWTDPNLENAGMTGGQGGAFGYGVDPNTGASLDPYSRGAVHGGGFRYAPQPGGVDPHSVYYNQGRFNEWRDSIGQSMLDSDAAMQDWYNQYADQATNQMMGQAGQGAQNMRSEAMAGGTNMSAMRGATGIGNEMVAGTRMDAENVRRHLEEQSRLQQLMSAKQGMADLGQFWDAFAGHRNQEDEFLREQERMEIENRRHQREQDEKEANAAIAAGASSIPLVGGALGGMIQGFG